MLPNDGCIAQLVPDECVLYFSNPMQGLLSLRARVFALRVFLFMMLISFSLASAQAKPAKIHDLADSVSANPILTKFAAIIQASDLGTFLSSRGPFTLFVPTDAAFDKLPPGTLETLLRPENKVRLQDILLFHVVNGKRLTAKDLLPLKTTLSCQGAPLTFRTTHTGVQLVQKAKILHADIRCQNGVINEIDTVLMPPEASMPPIALPPPPAPATNAPSNQPSSGTNAAPSDTNSAVIIPVAPTAAPENAPQ
jgi:uncharacterized surface protein with fasciclin (FAS1) repeats